MLDRNIQFLVKEPRRWNRRRMARKRSYEDLFMPSKKPKVIEESSPSSCSSSEETLDDSFNILDLPTELMGHIFGFLSILDLLRTQTVCQRWHWLVQNVGFGSVRVLSYSTLQGFTDAAPLIKLTDHELHFLLRRCGKSLRVLDMHELRWGFREELWSVKHTVLCPRLKTLNLSGIQISSRALVILSKNCPLLEDVNFNSSLMRPGFEDYMRIFFENCKLLRSIDLGGNWFLDGNKSFQSLPLHVDYLNIDFVQLTEKPLQYIISRCPCLTTFVVNNFMVDSVELLEKFFSKMKKLNRLAIDCLADPHFRIGRVRRSLLQGITELTITNAPLFTEPMQLLGNRFTNLKYLDLRERTEGFSGSGLLALANLSSLTCLSLSDLRWLHDSVLTEIAKKGILKVLLLHCCVSLTDRGIFSVLKSCKDLVCLDLSGCVLLTNDIVEALINYSLEREHKEKTQRFLQSDVVALAEDISVVRLPRRRRDAMLGPQREWKIGECVSLGADSGWKKSPFDLFRDRLNAEAERWKRKAGNTKELRNVYTELHVWVGNCDIDPPIDSRHHLLKIYDNHPVNRPYFRLGVKEIR